MNAGYVYSKCEDPKAGPDESIRLRFSTFWFGLSPSQSKVDAVAAEKTQIGSSEN